VSENTLQDQLEEAKKTIRALEEELAETNRGLIALTLELEQRVDERTKELRQTHAELQKANLELTQLASELRVANEELEAFSVSVSHDLRAPLRTITGFTKVLLEDHGDRLDNPARNYLERMCLATQRMEHLIADLLELSRVSRSEMRHETIDLSGLARVITSELQESAKNREVSFTLEPELKAEGDPRLLRIALENLFSNAWKFTGRNPNPRIEFGVTLEDGAIAYFVRDNGAGFDMAYADRLFGAFQRFHNATDYPGTGVGLATVQRIVQRHGGKVWAESALGKGATFYFTLPKRGS
jgi:light-regulated signal transduction histidine kinase (bacteriophytochrome)